ncbi:MAG: 3-mercaptopyruvate sulfurtransferase [Rhizobiaceae bacterium]|nr:3-mercaptopyruvate sulfurtransferase [Rhizobiaceae bacterium]
MAREDFFVTADWLEANLEKPGLTVVDGAWYLPAQQRDAKAEYEAGHIPGAVFFDHDGVVDPDSDLPHTIPSPDEFARQVGAMGISETDDIVVYDGPGLFSSARTWWLFRTMGAKKVRILEGGLDGWKREGRPLTANPTKIAPAVFIPDFDARRVVALEEMRGIVAAGGMQIADARPSGRFEGSEAEPRAGLRSGHMPGAANLPVSSLSREGRLLDADELRQLVADAGIDPRHPVVATCGSGVSAAAIVLALATLGQDGARLYDGSWTEWASRDDTPVETGKPGRS